MTAIPRESGPLHGIPVIVKDNYETVGHPLCAQQPGGDKGS